MDSLDSAFLAGLKDDMSVFDGKVTIRLVHILKNPQIDFDNGSIADGSVEYTIAGCLFRNQAARISSTQKMMGNVRQMAPQNDAIPSVESVVEIPAIQNIQVSEGDSIFVAGSPVRWRVVSVDMTTISSRVRAAVQRLN